MRLNIFLSLSFLLASFAYAQNTIKGTLFERGTKDRLANTNIFILPYKLKAVTDDKGEFVFSEVPDGEFDFVVNKSGYLRLDKKSQTRDKDFDLYLEKEFYDVFETVVTGKEIKKDVSKKSLSQKEFLKAPGAQEDPVKAVQNLPGVANQPFSSQIVIQGSEPDGTRYSINGHEIPLIFHFAGLTSVVTPTAVDEVEFLAAGFGSEYGRAIGGIINLKTRDARDDRWRGQGFLDVIKAGALVEGPLSDKSSLVASVRASYFGAFIERAAEEMDEFSVTSAPEFKDFFVNYKFKASKDEEFSLMAISSQDTLKLLVEESNDPIIEGNLSNDTSFFRIIPRYKKKFNSKNAIDLSMALGKDEINFNLGERFFDLSSAVVTTRAEFQHKHSERFASFLGLDLQYREVDLDILLPNGSGAGGVTASRGDDIFARIQQTNRESAVYFRNVYKPSDQLTLSPNLRIERFSTTDETYFMPRLSSSLALSSETYLNFATGVYYQGPQNGESSREFGNPDIGAERSTHIYVSVLKDYRRGSGKGLNFEVGVFYKFLDDLIVNTSAKKSDGTDLRVSNTGKGTVKGAQIQGSYKSGGYTVLMSYTLLDSLRRDRENGEYRSEFDQTHNVNLIGVYERARWSFSTRLRYVTGGPYTPVMGSTYDSDNDVYIPTRGPLFSDRFDNFFQLDFRIDKKFIFKKFILSAYLDIQNLSNSNNGQGISYSFDYSQSSPANGTPLLPIIGLRGEF